MHDNSKATTLPVVREIVRSYLGCPDKVPWYIDLLNLNLDNPDVALARRRIEAFLRRFHQTGARITENLDFPRSELSAELSED